MTEDPKLRLRPQLPYRKYKARVIVGDGLREYTEFHIGTEHKGGSHIVVCHMPKAANAEGIADFLVKAANSYHYLRDALEFIKVCQDHPDKFASHTHSGLLEIISARVNFALEKADKE